MAVAKVQATASNYGFGSGTAMTSGTLGATPTVGNLLIALVWISNVTGTFSASGWSTLAPTYQTGEPHNVGILYKIAGASEPTSVTVNWVSSIGFYAGEIQILEYSGNDTVSPLDVVQSAWTSGYATTQIEPAITTITAGALDVAVLNYRDGGPGYTTSASGYATENDTRAWGVFTKTIAAPGSTGARSMTVTGNTGNYMSTFSFAIRPASGGGGGGGKPDYYYRRRRAA